MQRAAYFFTESVKMSARARFGHRAANRKNRIPRARLLSSRNPRK
jgi:hypothetical protein